MTNYITKPIVSVSSNTIEQTPVSMLLLISVIEYILAMILNWGKIFLFYIVQIVITLFVITCGWNYYLYKISSKIN